MTYKDCETLGAAFLLFAAVWFVVEQMILVNRTRRAKR